MRRSRHNTDIREFTITDNGLEVADTFESAEAVLTGLAQLRGAGAYASPYDGPSAPTEP